MTSQEFSDFLQSNPTFLGQYLAQHPQQLANLYVPHATGGKTVSLVERQVEVLRDKVKQMERGIADMVRNAQENDAIVSKLYEFTRALLLNADTEKLPTVVEEQLRSLYAVPQTALRIWDVADAYQGLHSAQPVEVDVIQLANSMQAPYCGPNSDFRAVSWLDGSGSNTKSLVLIPLRVGASPDAFGLLVLGSPDDRRFTSSMGTAFLSRIGEVASAALSRLKA
jgi:uncharacterized protein